MQVETRNEADTSIYQTEKQLMEHKEKVPQEDQDAIKAAITAVKDAMADESTSSEALKEKARRKPRATSHEPQCHKQRATHAPTNEVPKSSIAVTFLPLHYRYRWRSLRRRP